MEVFFVWSFALIGSWARRALCSLIQLPSVYEYYQCPGYQHQHGSLAWWRSLWITLTLDYHRAPFGEYSTKGAPSKDQFCDFIYGTMTFHNTIVLVKLIGLHREVPFQLGSRTS